MYDLLDHVKVVIILTSLSKSGEVRIPKKQTVRHRLACRQFIGERRKDQYLWESGESGTGQRDKLD